MYEVYADKRQIIKKKKKQKDYDSIQTNQFKVLETRRSNKQQKRGAISQQQLRTDS